MKNVRTYFWEGPKHVEHDGLVELFDRQGQVWEDTDGWTYFIVGAPVVTTYEEDGRPFQYRHAVFAIDDEGKVQDWPLYETNDRPLELTIIMSRLA